jgi:hypothetical protein
VNWSAPDVEDVPPGPVTVTSTVPADPAGAVAVICVAELTVKLVAGVDPKLTAVAPVKLVPEIVTEVPPPLDPTDGLAETTEGGPEPNDTALFDSTAFTRLYVRPRLYEPEPPSAVYSPGVRVVFASST